VNPRTVTGFAAAVLALATPLVAYVEGYVPRTYADPIGIPTICYGHTGADVIDGRTATRDECEALLHGDLAIALSAVQRCVVVRLAPHEAAALVSFTYNVGGKALCQSTLARKANAGAKPSEWCAELDRWVYASGVRLAGLVKRRALERSLCEKGKT
jgi:lysozyme